MRDNPDRKPMQGLAAAVLLLCIAMAPAAAETIVGHPRIIDGDTIEIQGMRIRLNGIDAPELEQRCRHSSEKIDHPCGAEAKAALERVIAGIIVTCERRNGDRDREVVATCWRGERFSRFDLAREMVRDGWAVADSPAYIADEAEARAKGNGLWAAERPEEWRREHPRR
jgi:endonuclease YncB( thermonuclease family)